MIPYRTAAQVLNTFPAYLRRRAVASADQVCGAPPHFDQEQLLYFCCNMSCEMMSYDPEDNVFQFPGDLGRKESACKNPTASLLRSHADSIDDTASRCTDPIIASELIFISSALREAATRFEI